MTVGPSAGPAEPAVAPPVGIPPGSLPLRAPSGDPVGLPDRDREPSIPASPPPAYGPAGLFSLRAWTRGERMIVATGVALAVVLWRVPWHRFGLTIADEFRRLGLGDPPLFQAIEPTALETPNAFLGKGALLLTALMVVAVVAAKVVASRRAVGPFWQQAHLVTGSAVLGLLVAKVVARGEFLAPGAWLAVALAGLLAYAGFTRSQESATAGDGPPATVPATPPPPPEGE